MASIDLWTTRPQLIDESLLDRYFALLPAEEQAEVDRFRCRKSRELTLIGRALVRHALSYHEGGEPAGWRFARSPFGKPFTTGDRQGSAAFNIAHTDGLVVCAVGRVDAVGVDAEHVERRNALDAIARRFYAPSEAAALSALPEPQRKAEFFRYWTLKEAFIKAHGAGLALPLDQFAFELTPSGPPKIRFDRSLAGDPKRWHFVGLRLGPHHVCAVAAETDPSETIELRIRRCRPLLFDDRPQVVAGCWAEIPL